MSPELSILIPVRDEEENVKIISNKIDKEIANPNYELLFVNDFSEDNTIKVIEEMKIQNNKIRYVNNNKKGLGGAISLGITEAKGKYICIMMSDSSDTVEDLNYESVMDIVTHGLGVMPAFGEDEILTKEQIDIVSFYVANSVGK